MSAMLWRKVFGTAVAMSMLCGPAKAQEKIIMALNWIPHTLHYGIYIAQDLGWYRQTGLDVTIQRGFGSGDTVKRVGTGTADIGLADAASVVVGRANNINTKIVAMLMDRNADSIYFVKGAGINTPKDLEGKTMGAAAGETSLNLLPAFAYNVGIDHKKIEIVTMSAPNKIPSLAQRRVDTIVTFTSEEPLVKSAGKKAGVEIGRFLFANHGVEYYSIAFLVSDKMIAEKPQVIRTFLEATLRGYARAFEKPDEALDIFLKHNPESSRDLMRQQWASLEYNMLTPTFLEKGLGHIEEDKMAKTLKLMQEFQNVKADLKPSDVYTLVFLPNVRVER
jgi:NitT/TauT family transport system substrate-binding protein